MDWVIEPPYFHVTQVVGDFDLAMHVYERLFAQPVSEGEVWLGRRALFTRVGGQTLETMVPGPDSTQLLKFVGLYGNHWHSLAWFVRNVDALAGALLARGVQLATTEGRHITEAAVPRRATRVGTDAEGWSAAMWTRLSPSNGIHGMHEFCEQSSRATPAPSGPDPLGVVRGSHATIAVRSASEAASFWCDVVGGERLAEVENSSLESRSVWVLVGDPAAARTLVEFAEPVGDGGLAQDREASGVDILHAYTFLVDDLGVARGHLAREGFGLEIDDRHLVVTDPATTGVRYGFTDVDVAATGPLGATDNGRA